MNRILAILIAGLVLLPSPLLAAAPGFCAYNSATQTGWQAGLYGQVAFDTMKVDTTSQRYDAANWTFAPIATGEASEWVDFIGQIQINAGIPANFPDVVVAKVVKNGMLDVQTGQAILTGNALGMAVVQFHARDVAQPGDYYWLILYVSSISGQLVLDNNPAHTFWCGTVLK